jgi:hypothetical protein
VDLNISNTGALLIPNTIQVGSYEYYITATSIANTDVSTELTLHLIIN